MDLAAFMESFGLGLVSLFGDGLLFLGLQGSHGRGEVGESSDIDPVVILEKCGRDELLRYRSFIDGLPEKDIICGFVASGDELRAWDVPMFLLSRTCGPLSMMRRRESWMQHIHAAKMKPSASWNGYQIHCAHFHDSCFVPKLCDSC